MTEKPASPPPPPAPLPSPAEVRERAYDLDWLHDLAEPRRKKERQLRPEHGAPEL